MKMALVVEKLKEALNTVERAISARSTLPVLNNIALKTDGGEIVIEATDLEIGISHRLTGKVEEEGGISVPGRIFSGLVSQITDESITLESKENNLILKTKSTHATLAGGSLDDYPVIPLLSGDPVLVVERGLKEALSQVIFATSIDETRPILTGVYFSFNKEGLILAATDSYRLAEKKTNLKVSKLPLAGAIVPTKAVSEVARLVDGEKVVVYLSENQIVFEVGAVRISSRLIDGEYPHYQEIIPKNPKTKAVVSAFALLSLLRAAALFTKESGGVKLDFVSDKVIVKASASQLGNFESSLPLQLEGENVEVSFNPQYLIDGLVNARADEVSLEMGGKTSPALIRPLGDESFIYIAMPLRA